MQVMGLTGAAWLCAAAAMVQTTPPAESTRPALAWPHFPSRMHAFVWRNWECYPPERLGAVIGATADQVRAVGHAMGLPDWPVMDAAQQRRNYICVIRRNWHLLNYEQLLKLLDWTPAQLAYALREDDFLWHKLGDFKPACEPIRYADPTPQEQTRCEQIREIIAPIAAATPRPEPRFAFVDELSRPLGGGDAPAHNGEGPLRYLYSYFAVYGDPLLNPDLDPYPDGLLQRLRRCGVNGVWMHVVLRELAPHPAWWPEKDADHDQAWRTRLTNLRKLVERAARHGVKIYLYMNEPRAMPEKFFENLPELRGVKKNEFVTLCTSTEPVRQWIGDALAHVFREVPGLGGVFTISASENLTNCCSHFRQAQCPRCSKRPLADVIAEVNRTIAEGVRRSAPDARVIVWDWAWPNNAAADIIRQLPEGVIYMSVSEWDQPFTRGGVESKVGEYSISVVGPGPRATRHWELARARGLQTAAKMQVNCTWEISALPFLPVMDLVAEHCVNLRQQRIDGQMLSWTLGGYPSPNLRLVQKLFDQPELTARQALAAVARERYGDEAILPAWTALSRAFAEYPYSVAMLYAGPQQVGPANLLFAEPTGLAATMVGFPYDDLNRWRGTFPPEVFASQLEKLSEGWQAGIALMEQVAAMPRGEAHQRMLQRDLDLARAAGIHFASVVNQVRFILARGQRMSPQASAAQKAQAADQQRRLLASERRLAQEMLQLVARDSRIGYEASNHYYYLPVDLLEKIVSCAWLEAQLAE